MALRPVGTASAHVRVALHLLSELDGRLRRPAFAQSEGYALVRLLAATRRQLWLAVAALDPEPRPLHGAAVMMWVAVVAWPTRALTFVLRCGHVSARSAMWLVRIVHAIWP